MACICLHQLPPTCDLLPPNVNTLHVALPYDAGLPMVVQNNLMAATFGLFAVRNLLNGGKQQAIHRGNITSNV
jgi:hypothetical protein